MLERHLVPKLGHLQLRQVDRAAVNDFYASLAESGRVTATRDAEGKVTQAGLGPRSVRLAHTILHRALEDAVEEGLIARNPTQRASVPTKVRSATPSWTAEQLGAFLEHAEGHRLHAAFVLLANTGLRRSELLGLRWADVDLERSTLAVRQVVGLDGYRPYLSEPKTAQSRRVVALDPSTVAVLRSHHRRQAEERLATGPAWTETGLVFTREDGNLVHPQTVSTAFEGLVASSGLPRIGVHGLRHSHISLGLAAGIPLQLMSERAGHHSVALTGDVYSHSLPSQHHDAAAALAALLGAPSRT